jgi:hypothetical protein
MQIPQLIYLSIQILRQNIFILGLVAVCAYCQAVSAVIVLFHFL